MRTAGRRKTTSHAWKKQGPGKNSACPLISSRSPHTRSDQSEPTFAGIRPTDVPPFRAAQIVGARFAFFVSLAHVKDRLKQGDGAFESGRPTPVYGLEEPSQDRSMDRMYSRGATLRVRLNNVLK